MALETKKSADKVSVLQIVCKTFVKKNKRVYLAFIDLEKEFNRGGNKGALWVVGVVVVGGHCGCLWDV